VRFTGEAGTQTLYVCASLTDFFGGQSSRVSNACSEGASGRPLDIAAIISFIIEIAASDHRIGEQRNGRRW